MGVSQSKWSKAAPDVQSTSSASNHIPGRKAPMSMLSALAPPAVASHSASCDDDEEEKGVHIEQCANG